MKTLDDQRIGRVLENLAHLGPESSSDLSTPTVISCGGVFLRRPPIASSLRGWSVRVNLPHEEGSRSYRLNPQTTESVFHLVLRKESLN
ncbi:MAG: hypothetical protein Q7S98_06605 [Deltaproteobacteria bacterium]|nr:hypothetical protein [Deltaproteobacteria bacterium]